MTSIATSPARPGLRDRVDAFSKLGKLAFFDYYLSALVVWTLLPAAVRANIRTPIVLAVISLGWVGVVVATVTFDDVTGFRDGSDQFNYDPAQGTKRNRARKPLLDGRVTAREAVRFGWIATLWGAAWLASAFAIAPRRPAWAIGLTIWVIVTSVQYSYGLKLSYRGGQELLMLVNTGLTVLIPYALLAGKISGTAVAQSCLFGFFSLLVPVYSNMNDIAGDRSAGRRNLATLLAPRYYRGVVAALTGAEFGVVIAAACAGYLAAWFPIALLPVVVLRVRQMRAGLSQGDPLTARRIGIRAHRLGVVLLLAANLIAIA